jgi:putative endonuclease
MPDPPPSSDNPASLRRSIGGRGEDVAALYLRRMGCTILARRWYANPGEIDIIARCPANSPAHEAAEPPSTLAFIEVRTRHGQPGLAEESISPHKAASMIAAAYAYMQAHDIDPEATPWRIDLVAVTMSGYKVTNINWAKGALESEG